MTKPEQLVVDYADRSFHIHEGVEQLELSVDTQPDHLFPFMPTQTARRVVEEQLDGVVRGADPKI